MSFLDDVINLLPFATVNPLTALQRNVMTIPAFPPASVRNDALQHPDAGPPGGEGAPQRVVAVLGPGTTFEGIADTLLPLYTTVASGGGQPAPPKAPTVDELARAIAVYTSVYLHADSWDLHTVGTILPLPIEIDAGTGEWIVNADRVRELTLTFKAAWRPRLRTAPAALAVPDPFALQTQAAALAATPVATLAPQLWTKALRNPSDAVLLFLATLRALDSGGAGPAASTVLAALGAATATQAAQLKVLAVTRAGNGILRRFRTLLSTPPAGLDPAAVTRAQTLLTNALQPGGTLVVHHEVPETTGQQADIHRLVLGRDVAVGRSAPARVNDVSYTGPEFPGGVALEPYLAADADHLNPGNNPRMPALLTLLAGGRSLPGTGGTGNGLLDSVRARDDTLMTAGLGHWRATKSDELPALLFAYNSAVPDEFDLFFALHGLDVQPGPAGGPAFQLRIIGSNGTSTVPDAATLRTFFGVTDNGHGRFTYSSDWAARFRLPALVSLAYRRVQVAQATALVASTADPVTLHAAAVLPFPATSYVLAQDGLLSGALARTVTNAMTGNVTPPAASSVLGRAKTNHAHDTDTLAAALVDLTGGTTTPAYAGFFDDKSFYVGSMAKIMPMYAAHELRFRIQQIVTSIRRDNLAATSQTIFHAIGKAWGPQVCRVFPDFPTLDVRYPGRFPKLDTIFTIADDGTVRFRKGAATEDDIAQVGEKDIPPTDKMTFYHWQKLMILWSHDGAAGLVIDAIGFPYINHLLRAAGFYHPDTRLGLWISGNYASNDWKQGKDLFTLSDRGERHYKRTTNFVATPREAARLLALAALHKLCDGDVPSCDDMIQLMRKHWLISAGPPLVLGGGTILGGAGTQTFIGESVALVDPDTVSSKIGLSEAQPVTGLTGSSDCAIITRTEMGTPLRYVAVILGGYKSGADSAAFAETAIALDDNILVMH
jgi:hypothetical protein